jgi:hypothetical protein
MLSEVKTKLTEIEAALS